MNLENKIALVTGGAKGIGREIACTLALAGATVIVHFNKSSKEGEETVSHIRQNGGRAFLAQADFSDTSVIKEFFTGQIDKILAEIPGNHKLDILVNNAGTCERTFLQTVNDEQFFRMMTVNFLAPTVIIKEAVERFNSTGRIINLSSIMAKSPDSRYLLYAASKAALNNVAKALVNDLGKRGITINTIAPGLIPTAILKGFNNPLITDYISKHTALKRVGTAQDIAKLVLLVASEGSGWITGQVIEADGGYKN